MDFTYNLSLLLIIYFINKLEHGSNIFKLFLKLIQFDPFLFFPIINRALKLFYSYYFPVLH